jgi:Tol biopolymer transport system component
MRENRFYSTWSPNGLSLLFLEGVSGNDTLMITDPAGSTEHALVQSPPYPSYEACYSKDGSMVVFRGYESGPGYRLYTVPSTGGKATVLANDAADYPCYYRKTR